MGADPSAKAQRHQAFIAAERRSHDGASPASRDPPERSRRGSGFIRDSPTLRGVRSRLKRLPRGGSPTARESPERSAVGADSSAITVPGGRQRICTSRTLASAEQLGLEFKAISRSARGPFRIHLQHRRDGPVPGAGRRWVSDSVQSGRLFRDLPRSPPRAATAGLAGVLIPRRGPNGPERPSRHATPSNGQKPGWRQLRCVNRGGCEP